MSEQSPELEDLLKRAERVRLRTTGPVQGVTARWAGVHQLEGGGEIAVSVMELGIGGRVQIDLMDPQTESPMPGMEVVVHLPGPSATPTVGWGQHGLGLRWQLARVVARMIQIGAQIAEEYEQELRR